MNCHETKKTCRRASSNSSWLFGSVWTREKLPAGHPGDTARSKYISHTNCSSLMPVDISSTHNTTFSSKPECSSNNVICPKDKMNVMQWSFQNNACLSSSRIALLAQLQKCMYSNPCICFGELECCIFCNNNSHSNMKNYGLSGRIGFSLDAK